MYVKFIPLDFLKISNQETVNTNQKLTLRACHFEVKKKKRRHTCQV